ncbi:MAG: spermidine synthase, partial [Acidobacteriota bacterium]
YRMVGPYLPTVMRSLAAPNVRIIFTDPRRFLQKSGRYDVILVAMPEPTSGAANRFYTKEFFSTCAGRLNPGGVVGFRLQSSENYWPPLLSRRMGSIDRAARSAFPYLIVLPGTTNVFLASSGPLPSDAAVLEDRLNARRIHATLVSGPFLRYLYTNDRRAEIARTLKGGGGPENTDGRPICYQYAAVMWLSKFFPAMAATELPTMSAVSGGGAAWILWICILAMFGLSRISGMWRRALLVGVAGFAGMVLETVLILHFQMKNGIIFQDIGMLLTGFMAGLAAGSVGFTLLARSRDGSGRAFRWSGATILGGLVSLGLLVERAADTGAMGGLVSVSVLLGAAGVLVAALFAYASLHRNSDQSRLVSPLYAADLLGGCAGSLLASLLLIPMAGLALSARYVAVLAVLALVLL